MFPVFVCVCRPPSVRCGTGFVTQAFAPGGASQEQRDRLLQTTDRLDGQSRRLEDSKRTMMEIEDTGESRHGQVGGKVGNCFPDIYAELTPNIWPFKKLLLSPIISLTIDVVVFFAMSFSDGHKKFIYFVKLWNVMSLSSGMPQSYWALMLSLNCGALAFFLTNIRSRGAYIFRRSLLCLGSSRVGCARLFFFSFFSIAAAMEITLELGRNREKIGEVHDKVRYWHEHERKILLTYNIDIDMFNSSTPLPVLHLTFLAM